MRDTNQIINQWKDSIEYFIIRDIKKCLDDDFLETGLVILSLTGIECISGYYCGQEANKNTFINFLNSKYFPDIYNLYSIKIYENLRNGLLHDQVIKYDVFTLFRREDDAPHLHILSLSGSQSIAFNREVFAKDFLSTWQVYSSDILTDPQLYQNLLRRIGDKDRRFLIIKNIMENKYETDVEDYGKSIDRGGTVGY